MDEIIGHLIAARRMAEAERSDASPDPARLVDLIDEALGFAEELASE